MSSKHRLQAWAVGMKERQAYEEQMVVDMKN